MLSNARGVHHIPASPHHARIARRLATRTLERVLCDQVGALHQVKAVRTLRKRVMAVLAAVARKWLPWVTQADVRGRMGTVVVDVLRNYDVVRVMAAVFERENGAATTDGKAIPSQSPTHRRAYEYHAKRKRALKDVHRKYKEQRAESATAAQLFHVGSTTSSTAVTSATAATVESIPTLLSQVDDHATAMAVSSAVGTDFLATSQMPLNFHRREDDDDLQMSVESAHVSLLMDYEEARDGDAREEEECDC